ncbi:MAG: biosynthetic-type acetolactate synthase large subunit [Acetobacter sp.]|nr:biosynthetic-type acetolactate synthase large subunit [Bacteroides sp.]MCM1340470.1 biosynthetic-type acetolactate synthase large subunit [Acetobacter sp.]MCM1433210.1 biosynthetic-type acetolactate synthase large subunit [Clostridiales bacterium]
MKLNGSQIVLEVLKEQGVDTIFGYPGGTILNIFDELYKYGDTFNHILTAHEQGASHAADGYARATGKVGVCFATSGPGATNLVTGIATAYMDSIPVVAITCNYATSGLGRDSFQEIDITGVTMPITKHNFMVKNVEELAPAIRRAFLIAQSGRKGPVLVDIPKDITAAMCEYNPEPKVEAEPFKLPKQRCVDRAVELLKNSKKPVIYVGGGAILSNASEELITFAEKIDAPVVSSLMGLGAFPNGHPLHLGLIGMHGHYECNKAAHDCDVLIVAGARFSDRVAGNRAKFAPNAEILHIDIDSAEMDKNIVSNYHLRGDLASVLPILTHSVEQLDHSDWKSEIDGFKRPFNQLQIGDYVNPQTLIERIDAVTADDTIVVTDVGQHQLWAAQFYKYTQPRTLLSSGGLGTMGYSMGAAMGGQVGCPDKQVVMFAGDGGFHMNLSELATMASYNIPVKMFIMNNTVLGMVRQWQKIFYGNRFADTDPHRATDFVKVAEAFGVKGMRINNNDEIDEVLKEAFSTDGPVLIDCRISPDSNVLPMIPPGGSVADIKEEM